jgi:hypothetical protein
MCCKGIYVSYTYIRNNSSKRTELRLYGRDHLGEPYGAQPGPHGWQHGRPYGAHKSIIPKASTASVFMGAHGPVSLCCCSDGGSWAWSRGVGGNIGLIPHTSYICIRIWFNLTPSWAHDGTLFALNCIATWKWTYPNVNSSGPPWILSNPFATHLGPIGFQKTTTINMNTNNRFLLPRGGLTDC